jgi:N-acetylmuramoyl-L-alanine amidase
MYKIDWYGNKNTNKSSREGVKPFVIVDHIAEGTLQAVGSWFTNADNKKASAHFCVGKQGEIHQYVKIEDFAWSNGLPVGAWADPGKELAQVVRDMSCNPNYYTVSIEHDGDTGELTDAQFQASCWLHRYIMDYVRNTFGVQMALGNYNVIAHCDIDPVRKPCCPGDQFPWTKLYAELAIAEKMTLQEYEMRLQFQQSGYMTVANAVKVKGRVEDLYGKLSDSKNPYYKPALEKLSMIYKLMDENDLLDNK